MRFAERMDRFGEGIFSKLLEIKRQKEERGETVIDLGVGALKSNMDYGMFLPVQMAAIAAITGDQACVEETRKAYERRRDALCDGMTAIGWKMEKPEATMFVWAKIPDKFSDSSSFALELAEKSGLLVTSGSAFGPSGEGYVRLALVQDEDVLKKAAELVDESGMLR